MNLEHLNKHKKLVAGIVFDAIGYASFIIPGIGEIIDLAWAPASAWLMTKMYKGPAGKVGAAVSFIEEIMPGLDIVPTFTLMWLYTYVFQRQRDASADEQIINIK